jgi:hypothetical protein
LNPTEKIRTGVSRAVRNLGKRKMRLTQQMTPDGAIIIHSSEGYYLATVGPAAGSFITRPVNIGNTLDKGGMQSRFSAK